MQVPAANTLVIPTLGPCRVPSPLQGTGARFVNDTRRILVSAATPDLHPFLERGQLPPSFELAGPRAQLYFDPMPFDPHGEIWQGVLEATGQPAVMLGRGATAQTGVTAPTQGP